jgi:hypothetical protein
MGGGSSKNILPGDENPLPPLRNTPVKTSENLNTITVPLCSAFPDEGQVEFLTQRDLATYNGFFSFTIYYRREDEFPHSHYYHGLMLYAEMIHTHPFFENAAILLYTDTETLPILKKAFSTYTKVIYAVTKWPRFTLGDKIEDTVLRCMRFQALDAFPTAWVCTRDADTIFTSEIMNAHQAYSKGYKGTTADGTQIDDYRPFLAKKIGDWEAEFFHYWHESGLPINLGVNIDYKKRWHQEFPLIYSIKNLSAKYSNEGYDGARLVLKAEKGGRFTNYYKRTKNQFVMAAPGGIFAGFTNFAKHRPQDIWTFCYDYITSHYDLVETNAEKHTKEISNYRVDFVDRIGKDERILLFTLLPKYIDLCYFFSIEYYGGTWLYNDLKNKYSISNDFSEFSTLLNLGPIPDFEKKKRDKKNNDPDVRIYTVLFTPKYIKNIYTQIFDTEEFIKQHADNNFEAFDRIEDLKEERKMIDFKPGPLHLYHKQKFSHFVEKYLTWIMWIMALPSENIDRTIHEIEKLERIAGQTNDYRAINNSDFYRPIQRVHPRTPIFSKGGKRKTRRKQKIQAAYRDK